MCEHSGECNPCVANLKVNTPVPDKDHHCCQSGKMDRMLIVKLAAGSMPTNKGPLNIKYKDDM